LTVDYDIVIVGSGIVGATAALALAQEKSLSIALIDHKNIMHTSHPTPNYTRVSAITRTSRNILSNLNVWPAIAAQAISPFKKMLVWENERRALEFNAETNGDHELGFIIADNIIRESLLQQAAQQSNINFLSGITITELKITDKNVNIITATQNNFTTKLLIAADGANSWLRDYLQIPMQTFAYDQTAIVSTVTTQLSHQQTAWQHFLATGPLAFLPLADPNLCSIVWSAQSAYAQKLLALPADEFNLQLSHAAHHKLGAVTQHTELNHFPLRMRHVKTYVQNRFALIGDAAHTIHPLAGQGVNLGMLDAACLAEVILKNLRKKRDYTTLAALRPFERWRKTDTATMLGFINYLNKLYTSENKFCQQVRQLGLSYIDKNTLVKKYFSRYAQGYYRELPLIAQQT
jgi:2-octaprenylphenol hydroxylase